MAKKITIDDLAGMVQRGFIEVRDHASKFEREMYDFRDHMLGFEKETRGSLYELDRHARITNERLSHIDSRLESLERKVDGHDFSLKDHEGRITILELVHPQA